MKKPPATHWLPDDGLTGTLVGRAWVPGPVPGPSVIVLRPDGVYDLSAHFATMSDLLDAADPVAEVRAAPGRRVGSIEQLMPGAQVQSDDPQALRLLAPCDLQVIKAAGVTFAASLIERVIEEQARGDAGQAVAVRQQVVELLGGDLAAIRPGSPQAMQLKALLIEKGLWSQYLEVGIGPDAEVFTKAPVLSSVGSGAQIGIHPGSAWNNPEPEIVLAVNSRGDTVGASLGNDVNLRDFEGRSALLLGKAKDNNASCAIGPFIRLFDASYCLDDVRRCTVSLRVAGLDGFELQGSSSMAQISRDPLDLVAQTLGAHHQYPDGVMLFLGTMFAPTQDRGQPGSGFTHRLGDAVHISSPQLGRLVNEVNHTDRVAPWTFGLRAFYANLSARGLLTQTADATTP
ncbi:MULTISPECIES: fumarylacetoacetate hydrolase family protein [unclassified Polaromonas]|uniref:fumarylacetoacetate hydrolase family protein n=1 Tax=unclassified Polaromonas TaxID=2638319 RepID=UPI0018C92AE0|nr:MULTISPECIES: fumarylacetoacetate hydrolase family protein [unclassified Polaromonas]MBG6071436.1 fumarylacetoacetate (FAA) hydrolase family protein [Polaromonas sp. CG_9.7]MBG6113437.1 fumarylacetoacetate (FAA) hydrolase family protein [Polaromonas sp. CG_9.2]MDH6183106.1 fumarylacetoacetate (FAA) hydrolase family protein [Polaromonas sp. CG_23.6]